MGTTRGKGIIEQPLLRSSETSFEGRARKLIDEQLKKEPKSVIVVLGPTASGKTALALALAEYFPIEIISADSRLVYKDMDIGTAKPTKEEQKLVPHHLLDVVDPEERFTVADYQKATFRIIDDVIKRKKIPVLVGGTMLYIDSVINNYQLPIENEESALRKRIRAMSLEQLQKELLDLVPDYDKYIDSKNPVRLMRALQHYHLTGEWLWEKSHKSKPKYPYVLLGLSVDKEELKERVAKRIQQQIDDGLIEEVKDLIKKYPKSEIAMTGIGYRQVMGFLKGEFKKEIMIEQLNKDTLAYAKRQMTWWKRNKEIHWLQRN